MPSGFKYSSSRISPGGIAGPSQFGSLVIVFDADFVRMSVLPPKRHPVLLVHANAVAARLVALQEFEPVSGWNRQVIQTTRCVNQPQLSLHSAPEFARNSSCGPCVPLAKQVCRGLVRKRLDHT